MKERLEHIDYLKAVAITLVVLGHILIAITPLRFEYKPVQIIYSFHMPLFFFLSDFIIGKKEDRKFTIDFISNKILTLLLPWVSWTVISVSLCDGGGVDDIYNKLWFYPFNGYWFLPVLWLMFFLYFIYNWLSFNMSINKRLTFGIGIMFFILILGVIFHEYSLLMYAVYWFIFLFGSLIGKYDYLKSLITNDKCYFISTISLFALWIMYPITTNGIMIKSFFNISMFFLISITSSITLYNLFLSKKIPKVICNTLSYIGKRTLIIYLIPVTPIAIDFILKENEPISFVCLIAFGLSLIEISLRIVIGNILMHIPYLRYLLFGKK